MRAECWEWPGSKDGDGYGRILRDGRYVRTSRRSYEAFVGPIPEGMQVLHHCDNPACVFPPHLWLGTHADNMEDMKQKGRANRPSGRKNPNVKLTEAQIEMIRSNPDNKTQIALAKHFGVKQPMISKIINNQNWARR